MQYKAEGIISNPIFIYGKTYPYSGGEYDEYPVDDDKDGQEAEQQEPEPDKNVDFLVHWNKKHNSWLPNISSNNWKDVSSFDRKT